jgi:hypothetical protein
MRGVMSLSYGTVRSIGYDTNPFVSFMNAVSRLTFSW